MASRSEARVTVAGVAQAPVARRVTVDAYLAEDWAARAPGRRSENTVRALNTGVRPLAAAAAGMLPTALTRDFAEDFVTEALRSHVTAAYLACAQMIADGLVPAPNPFEGLIPAYHEATGFEYVDQYDMEVVRQASFDAFRSFGSTVWGVCALARFAPLALHEILSLRPHDVDVGSRSVRVRHGVRALQPALFVTQTYRTVALTDEAWAALAQVTWRPEETLLAAEHGGQMTLRSMNYRWSVLAEAAGLRGLKLRDLRHSHIADLVADGVPAREIGRRLGQRWHWRQLVRMHDPGLARTRRRGVQVPGQLRMEV